MIDHQNKVLVVEDDQAMRYYWEYALKKLGIGADFAERADTALALAFKHQYSVILMDVKLPGISGLEAATRIREHEKLTNVEPTIIVAVTGGSASEASCREAGMDHYFRKPHLLEDVQRILEKTAPALLTRSEK